MTMFYHKIQSLYLRDPATKNRNFLEGQWSMLEFGYLAGIDWLWTEKVDGTNVRIIWDGEGVEFGGRLENSLLHAGLVSHLRATFVDEVLRSAFGDTSAVLFGEGFGAKIQKHGEHYRPDQGFVLFDVWCGGLWLQRSDVIDIARKLDIPFVPDVGCGTLFEAIEYVKSEPRSRWGDFPAEGIVMRPVFELQTRRGERIITKLKVRDFRR